MEVLYVVIIAVVSLMVGGFSGYLLFTRLAEKRLREASEEAERVLREAVREGEAIKKEKLIQIVLVGQPELKDLLTSSSMRQLNERIVVRFELRTLDPKDVRGYVEHRLVVGGGKGDLSFTNSAFGAIYKRNVINSGFPLIELKKLDDAVKKTGTILTFNLKSGEIFDKQGSLVGECKPISPVQEEIIEKGGLLHTVK